MRTDPTLLVARFGHGVGLAGVPPGASAASIRAALLAELAAGDPLPASPGLPTSADALAALKAEREARRANGGMPVPEARAAVRAILELDRVAMLERALAAPYGFRERLVAFWTNHFTVSIRQGGCVPLAGSFVREAIAPHVDGRFGDMLLAVMRHPAMLRYLENDVSVGPASPAGLRGHRGLNENLARECLELHTVSPRSGYTQQDVTSFAAILTGWSTEDRTPPLGFRFKPAAHEPGGKTLLGCPVPEGEAGGVVALAFLAGHPATHLHLATKLVRHFGADRPDPRAVARIASVLRDTGGDLGAASRALLTLATPPAAATARKFRAPQDLVLAGFRALALPASPHPPAAGMMAALGQPLFEAPLPNGWPDTEADWLGPQAALRRAEWAWSLAAHASPEFDPGDLAAATLGTSLEPDVAAAVRHAGSRREAVALLLASPAFQRR